MSGKAIVGVDFDNTIADYDDLLETLAVERGLLPARAGRSKQAVRDHVRTLQDGEIEWQRLQGAAYGPRIGEARFFPGVAEFFGLCRQAGLQVYIISHKTAYANYDDTRTNLRTAALDWMAAQGFFDAGGLGLKRRDVFFRSSRHGKIAKIVELACTHFIDDLEETFLESSFPPGVAKWHFCPKPGGVYRAQGCRSFGDWAAMTRRLAEEIGRGGRR